jgi:hypothetical protein
MRHIRTLQDLQKLESPSSHLSSQYVPMRTSSYLKALPGFRIKSGSTYGKNTTAHYVVLDTNTPVSLYVENSFNGSRSFRVRFVYDNFVFGNYRQIHKGSSAINMSENADNIVKMHVHAQRAIQYLINNDISLKTKQVIANTALKFKRKTIGDIVYIDYSFEGIHFINYIIQSLTDGNFTYEHNGKIKYLRPIKSQYRKLEMSSAIWDVLYKENPELFV